MARDDLPSPSWLRPFARVRGSTAARAALNQLESAGILRQVSVDRRSRVWEAHGIFAILDDLERAVGA